MRSLFLITLKNRRYSRYELGRLYRLGINHRVHHLYTNRGVFNHMNNKVCNVSMLLGEDYGEYDPNEEPEVEYDLIGDLPEEEPEESEDELQRIEWERIRRR